MGFIKRFFTKFKDQDYEQFAEAAVDVAEDELSKEQLLTGILMDKSSVDMDDSFDRQRYVKSLLEQIADAQGQMKKLQEEYDSVNAYLQDMELIDNISGADREYIIEQAKAILGLNQDRERYKTKKLRLSDKSYQKMDGLKDDAVEGMKKLRETEDYQQLIKQDLQRLEGEKQANLYRRHEAIVGRENLRGMTLICIFSVFACLFTLLFLQFGFELDVKIGYIMTAFVAAVTLTYLYLKYQEADKELAQSSRTLNQVIILQNKVKIRYINNTNLLDYLYMKYDVDSAKLFEKQWEAYLKEKEVREYMEKTEEDLDYHETKLIDRLKEYHLFDPHIWMHQAQAICNPKEMVEVRHGLILRRQKLRKQMEFNTINANRAQEEVKTLVAEYPAHANEILKMVSSYAEE